MSVVIYNELFYTTLHPKNDWLREDDYIHYWTL